MEWEVRDPYTGRLRFQFSSGERSGYGFVLGEMGTANFYLPRGDEAIEDMASLMPGRKRVGMMVTPKRGDSLFPWAGWVTGYSASPGGVYYGYTAKDAGYLLQKAEGAKTGTFTGSAGKVLREVLAEMKTRYTLPISLERLEDGGPYVDYTPAGKKGLSIVQELARLADHEWWFDVAVTPERVEHYLRFGRRRGRDRRGTVIWRESQHVNVGQYSQDADGIFSEALVVGGTGTYAERPAVSANAAGASRAGVTGVSAPARTPTSAVGSPIFEGTSSYRTRAATEVSALTSAAQRLFDVPEEFGESIEATLIEPNVEMNTWGIGDIVTVALETADLGVPVDLPVRVMGLEMDPDSQEHRMVLQVRAELI